jgi:hypothetical protein
VTEIRGQGLMLGIELAKPCGVLTQRAAEQGLLISVTADNVIRLVPPLILTEADADEIVALLAPLVREFLGMTTMAIQHYLQFSDLTAREYAWVFERAAIIKKKFKAYEKYHPLADRTLAMIFEKASTRTA